MLVILKRDDEEISLQAAKLIASAVRKKPALTLGLALAAPWSASTNISWLFTNRARSISLASLPLILMNI